MIREIFIDDIGNIKLRKSRRSRAVKISVRPFGNINVSIPQTVSFSEAEKFVVQRKEWIKASIEKFKKIENKQTIFERDSVFKTHEHFLKILPHTGNTIKIIIKNKVIYVFYPENAEVKDPRIQKAIRKAVLEAWRIEAKKYLPQRVKDMAEKHGFKFNNVTIKNAGTRWGSCSFKNNINLNIQLMRLPQNLCDYIILHELAHTVEKNHGKSFWDLLDKISGNAKMLDKELKNYSLNTW